MSTPTERVGCITQLAKVCFNNSIGRSHSWVSFFDKPKTDIWFDAIGTWFNCCIYLAYSVRYDLEI